jgi:WD40 repeat protein
MPQQTESAATSPTAAAKTAATLVELATLRGHADRVWCAAWSPSGHCLASCSGDKSVRLWVCNGADQRTADSAQWHCSVVLDGVHTRTVRALAWSPSGEFLASASFDGTTAIWQNQDGEFECVATLSGHENEVKSVAWSASGTLIATCSRDKSVWVWEADADGEEYECASVLHGHSGG